MSLWVGIVGAGEIAKYHARHLRGAGARVVAAVARRPLADVRTYSSLSKMLPEVDAVTIAVPNNLHAQLCMEALDAGKAVFVEKPLCIDEREIRPLEVALLNAASPVHVGFRLRWNPALQALQARLRGTRRVQCVYQLGIERLAAGKPWTRRQAESGGAFCTLGVHALDLARWLAGAEARPLTQLRASATERGDSADFPLLVQVQGTIQEGPEIGIGADLRGDLPFHLRLEIEADRGRYPDATLPGPVPEDPAAADVEYAGMMKSFVDAAVRGQPATKEVAEILQSHKELLVARVLAERGKAAGSGWL